MKKKILVTLAFITSTALAGKLIAQQTAALRTAGYDLKKAVKCRISNTPDGCAIEFDHQIVSPRDPASGMATGKRMHKPFIYMVSAADNAVSEITSPRDVSTGQSSGKVSYSDLSVMISLEKGKSKKIDVEDGEFSLPSDLSNGDYIIVLSWSWGASNPGNAKRCQAAFTVTIQDGVCMAINEKGHAGTKG
jgi:hypothetical protein